MDQYQVERAVARMTGESLSTIRRRGFSVIETPDYEALIADQLELAEERSRLFGGKKHRPSAAA